MIDSIGCFSNFFLPFIILYSLFWLACCYTGLTLGLKWGKESKVSPLRRLGAGFLVLLEAVVIKLFFLYFFYPTMLSFSGNFSTVGEVLYRHPGIWIIMLLIFWAVSFMTIKQILNLDWRNAFRSWLIGIPGAMAVCLLVVGGLFLALGIF